MVKDDSRNKKYKIHKYINTHISGMDTWTKTMVAIKVLTAFKKRRKKKKEAEVCTLLVKLILEKTI